MIVRFNLLILWHLDDVDDKDDDLQAYIFNPVSRRKLRVGREYRWCRILHKRFYSDVKNSRDGYVR
ncbi:MAG: hypothetical protein U9N83_18615 [Thermodesulfobacteriota bacterium]|nr:hypothetical protein [Thermodesulfobacteriota bacterium]